MAALIKNRRPELLRKTTFNILRWMIDGAIDVKSYDTKEINDFFKEISRSRQHRMHDFGFVVDEKHLEQWEKDCAGDCPCRPKPLTAKAKAIVEERMRSVRAMAMTRNLRPKKPYSLVQHRENARIRLKENPRDPSLWEQMRNLNTAMECGRFGMH